MFSDYFRKFRGWKFCMFINATFYVFISTFWSEDFSRIVVKIFFLEFEYWFFNSRQKRFKQGCKTCLACVRRKLSSKHIFLKSVNSIHLLCFLKFPAKKIKNLCIKTYRVFPKTTLYLCRRNNLGNKCLKIKSNFNLNRLQLEGVRMSVKKNRKGWVVPNSQKETFCNSSEIIN